MMVHLAECQEVTGTTQMCGKAYTVVFRCSVCLKQERINISRNAGARGDYTAGDVVSALIPLVLLILYIWLRNR